LALTTFAGNSWRLDQMVIAILPGFFIMPIMCVSLLFFEDIENLIANRADD
jgi:hypothetical protein